MGTYKKTLTEDCSSCPNMKINNDQMTCHWGKKEKVLIPKKGKKLLTCKLKKKES